MADDCEFCDRLAAFEEALRRARSAKASLAAWRYKAAAEAGERVVEMIERNEDGSHG